MSSRFSCCSRQRSSAAIDRSFQIGDRVANEVHQYPTNRVINTKYTWWSFLPRLLWDQFRRPMNIYFLLIAILQLFPSLTPVNPITTWLPLVSSLVVAGIREAMDDLQRRKQDRLANERLVEVFSSERNRFIEVSSQELCVGDIIRVRKNEEIPCDIALIACSDPAGTAYVQTANLDGETNLKSRSVPLVLVDEVRRIGLDGFLSSVSGQLECDQPNKSLHRFNGTLRLIRPNPTVVSLTADQLLLQVTHLKNTEYVIGISCYSGNQTKCGMNKESPPTKWTNCEWQISLCAIIIFCFQFSVVIGLGVAGVISRMNNWNKDWYLWFGPSETSDFIVFPLRFLLLGSYMIPISLKISMDLVRYFYSLLISWDLEMYDEESDTPAVASNTNISEDLGQIEYVLTDKTGTLTENRMEFKICVIDGKLYGSLSEPATQSEELRMCIANASPSYFHFIRCLGLCHAALPEFDRDSNRFLYKSASPDEEALVKSASDFGFSLTLKERNTLRVELRNFAGVNGPMDFEVRAILEFSSDRKRMSVVLFDPSLNKYFLYSKGADDVMLASLDSRFDQQKVNDIRSELNRIGSLGLRVLVVGFRELSHEDAVQWLDTFEQARNTAGSGRAIALHRAYSLIERDLIPLGVTAIEDRLQAGVPETIHALRVAGIKVWMLTGDKRATAVQIAQSCHLFQEDEQKIYLDLETVEDTLRKTLSEINRNPQYKYSLIIKGETLGILFHAMRFEEQKRILGERGVVSLSASIRGSHDELIRVGGIQDPKEVLRLFEIVSHSAGAVVCCRTSPSQKADVVKMVKRNGGITLAIGDGGNDVNMIQEAAVGVGIVGNEGLEASRSADYSFRYFRYLRRLLFVHGHDSYERSAFIAQYSYYKNIALALIQLGFNFFAMFSGVAFFNSISLTLYNFLTGIPPLAYAMDRDLARSILTGNPMLYVQTRRGLSFTYNTAIGWFFLAFLHAITIEGCVFSAYDLVGDLGSVGVSTVAYALMIILQQIILALYSHTLNWIIIVAMVGAVVVYWAILSVYTMIPSSDFYWIWWELQSSPRFWFTLILVLVLCLLPIILWRFVKMTYFPSIFEYYVMKYGPSDPEGSDLSDACFREVHSQELLSKTRLPEHSLKTLPSGFERSTIDQSHLLSSHQVTIQDSPVFPRIRNPNNRELPSPPIRNPLYQMSPSLGFDVLPPPPPPPPLLPTPLPLSSLPSSTISVDQVSEHSRNHELPPLSNLRLSEKPHRPR